MNFEQRVSEPKLSKCGTLMVRTVKIGNRLLGTVEMPKGKTDATFWATSEVIQVADGGRILIVSRIRVSGLGMYGVQKVGLRCSNGTTYLIAMQSVREVLSSVKLGAYVGIPSGCWTVELPPEEVRVLNIMDKMRVGRRKSSVTTLS